MTLPKIKACPTCKTDLHLAICTYDNGWRHVECLECNYLGPGEGSKLQAVRSHNRRITDRAAQRTATERSDDVG